MKNRVVDYVTPTEVCIIIGISPKSTPQITRWINEGKIKETVRFGNSLAIPVSWVKSECNERGISWQGVELENDETGVLLEDYIPLMDYVKENNLNYSTIYHKLKDGKVEDYIKFQSTYGLPKK